jgi:hypothetical protein
MFVRPYPVKVLQTLTSFITEQHYKKNYNQITRASAAKWVILRRCFEELVVDGNRKKSLEDSTTFRGLDKDQVDE